MILNTSTSFSVEFQPEVKNYSHRINCTISEVLEVNNNKVKKSVDDNFNLKFINLFKET